MALGGAMLWALTLVAYGGSPQAEYLSTTVGLAVPLVVSATGQILIAAGAALFGSGLRRR